MKSEGTVLGMLDARHALLKDEIGREKDFFSEFPFQTRTRSLWLTILSLFLPPRKVKVSIAAPPSEDTAIEYKECKGCLHLVRGRFTPQRCTARV